MGLITELSPVKLTRYQTRNTSMAITEQEANKAIEVVIHPISSSSSELPPTADRRTPGDTVVSRADEELISSICIPQLGSTQTLQLDVIFSEKHE